MAACGLIFAWFRLRLSNLEVRIILRLFHDQILGPLDTEMLIEFLGTPVEPVLLQKLREFAWWDALNNRPAKRPDIAACGFRRRFA